MPLNTLEEMVKQQWEIFAVLSQKTRAALGSVNIHRVRDRGEGSSMTTALYHAISKTAHERDGLPSDWEVIAVEARRIE